MQPMPQTRAPRQMPRETKQISHGIRASLSFSHRPILYEPFCNKFLNGKSQDSECLYIQLKSVFLNMVLIITSLVIVFTETDFISKSENDENNEQYKINWVSWKGSLLFQRNHTPAMVLAMQLSWMMLPRLITDNLASSPPWSFSEEDVWILQFRSAKQ